MSITEPCSRHHIAALVRFHLDGHSEITKDRVESMANELFRRSIGAAATTHKGTAIGQQLERSLRGLPHFTYQEILRARKIGPLDAIALVIAFQEQACHLTGADTSIAKINSDAILRDACRRLPGFDPSARQKFEAKGGDHV